MTAKFIQTDQVAQISDQQLDIAAVHEGHSPRDHICEGCSDLDVDACFAARNDLPPPPEEDQGPRRIGELHPGECTCLCHQLVDQCLLSQTAAKDAGKPLYRLEDSIDGWSIVMPQSVFVHFHEMPEQLRQRAMDMMIQHARSHAKAAPNTPDAH